MRVTRCKPSARESSKSSLMIGGALREGGRRDMEDTREAGTESESKEEGKEENAKTRGGDAMQTKCTRELETIP